MTLKATITGVEALAWLEAADATATTMTTGGRTFLDGPFVLKLQGQASLPLRVSGQAGDIEVTLIQGTTWRIVGAPNVVDADFPAGAPFRAGAAGGPRLAAPSGSLIRYNGAIWLVLKHVSISCLGGLDPVGRPDTISFPNKSGGGVGTSALTEWVATQGFPWPSGYPVIADPDGFHVVTGDRATRTTFDHARLISVAINNNAVLKFNLADASAVARPAVAFSDDKHARGITLVPAAASRLALSGRAFDSSEAPLTATRAVIADGLMSVHDFDADEVIAAYVDGQAKPAALVGAQSQFRFLLPIPIDGASPMPARAAQLVFTDARVSAGAAYTIHRQRFYGLSVGGLASVRTASEVIDCSLATATLEGGTFVFRAGAGDPLALLDQPDTPSTLLPKTQAGTRALQASAGRMRVGVNGTRPDLVFTTAGGGLLSLTTAELRGPPVGSPARDPKAPPSTNATQAYSDWTLTRKDAFPLRIDSQGVRAAEADWATRFDAPPQGFSLLEHPSAGFSYTRAPSLAAKAGVPTPPTQTGLQTQTVGGKELLVYTALVGALSYVRVECGNFDVGKCFKTDNIQFAFKTFDDNSGQLRSFVKGVAHDDLRIILGQTADGIAELHAFIDKNLGPPANTGKIQYGHWPFATGLSILLRQDPADGSAPIYCDDIIHHRLHLEGSISADLSATNTLPVTDLFGAGATWQTVSAGAPELWPRAASTTGIRSDPSFEPWSGTFFRNLPLIIVPSEGAIAQIHDKAPALAKLYDSLNESLLLDYGWHDEHGPTWFIKYQPAGETEFTPSGWESVIKLFLVDAESRGAQGTTVGGKATIRVELPCITDDQNHPLNLQGEFDLDLTGQKPIPTITIRSKSLDFATTNRLPGFSQVRIAAISTDFTSIRFDLELIAADDLVAAVPAFKSDKTTPMKAVMSLVLKGAALEAKIDLVLPRPIKSSLFGKFPISIEGLSLDLTAAMAKLDVNCRVDLGLPGLQNWVLLVHLTQKAGADFDLSVEVQRIAGKVDFGEMSLQGELTWLQKEFSGQLTLSGGVLGGSVDGLYARVGVQGDRPYWISALSAPSVGITAGASIQDPVLLLSHAMDYGNGELYGALTNVTKPLKGLRPAGAIDQGWLQQWNFAPSVGTAFAASGYLKFDDKLAGSAKDKDDSKGTYLTNLVITDDGRVRADAWLNLFSQLPARFVIAIDLKQKIMSAGMQLPAFKLPPDGDPEYEISPGFISVTVGYGDSPMVRYSIGWPSKVDGPGLERDWSQCTRVFVDGMYPINTFWGGTLVEYASHLSGGGPGMRLGIAIRAGWTKTYSAGGKGIASAEADIGITLGGAFVFAVYETTTTVKLGSAPVLTMKSQAAQELGFVIREASAALESSLIPRLASSELNTCVEAEIYGDIWGRGSAEFMGVTLASIDFHAYMRFVICGDLRAGITHCWASAGFDLSVTILCVKYTAHAETDITIKDGACPPQCADTGPAYTRFPSMLSLLSSEAH